MRIEFVRTGGFAGMRMATTVNTETLPPDEARVLRESVDAARFVDPALNHAGAHSPQRLMR
ncbi:MAG: hypothetical protein HW378_3584 [Anaerolineales bacterium]|nr:hypothetical protein [Anaerolineales bacterium]